MDRQVEQLGYQDLRLGVLTFWLGLARYARVDVPEVGLVATLMRTGGFLRSLKNPNNR